MISGSGYSWDSQRENVVWVVPLEILFAVVVKFENFKEVADMIVVI